MHKICLCVHVREFFLLLKRLCGVYVCGSWVDQGKMVRERVRDVVESVTWAFLEGMA